MENKETFVFTEEDIKNASEYMPLASKITLSKEIASGCIVPMKTADQNIPGLDFLALPELYEEDLGRKSIMLLSTLLGWYFDIQMPVDEEGRITAEIYDRFAAGAPLNQLERFKGNAVLRDKVFNIIADFKEFKKMVDTEIYNIKANNNDPVARFNAAVMIVSKPENITKLLKELQNTGAEYEKVLKENKLLGEKKAAEMRKGIENK